jgi:HK97 family phage major capsid protein
MSAIVELREKQAKLVADAREKLDAITDDTGETRAKELEVEYDKLMAEHDRLEGQIQRQQKLEDAEERMNTPDPRRPKGEDRTVEPEREQKDVEAIFRTYLRGGQEALDGEERKLLRELRAQAVGTDAAGGYTVPQGFQSELIESLKAYGPMLDPGVTRQIATASGQQIDWPTMDDTSNKGALLAENTQDTEQDVAFGQKQLDAYKYTSKIIRVSEELLQDSAFNVEQVIRDAMAERIGRIVNEHLTTGTGTGQPNGIVTASGAGLIAASGTAISFDDLIELFHSIDPAYRSDPTSRWMFNDATLKLLRKIKDANGLYIWQPADARTGQPATILDVPYAINQDMASVGLSAKSVVFGAMSRYIVRRVREFAVRRLVERYADFYQVGFVGFGRFDGDLVDTAAVKHLVHPAA